MLPYLYYPDAARALSFLVEVFGFTEIEALRDDGGSVWSAQLSTGDAVVLIGPEMAELVHKQFPTSWPHRESLFTPMMLTVISSVFVPSVRRSSPNLPITVPTAFTLPPIVVGSSGSSDRRRIDQHAPGRC